jgi:hypothetical protein
MKLEVKPVDSKNWGLYANGSLIGTSEDRFDVDHARQILENAFERVEKGLDHHSIPDATGDSSASSESDHGADD